MDLNNYVQMVLNISVKEPENLVVKYCLTSELLIFKYPQQNITGFPIQRY